MQEYSRTGLSSAPHLLLTTLRLPPVCSNAPPCSLALLPLRVEPVTVTSEEVTATMDAAPVTVFPAHGGWDMS